VAVMVCTCNAGKTTLKEVYIDTREIIVALIIKSSISILQSVPSYQESRVNPDLSQKGAKSLE